MQPVEIRGSTYVWRWEPGDDRVTVTDVRGRTVVSAPHQPILEFARGTLSSGRVAGVSAEARAVRVSYLAADGLSVAVRWRFDDAGCWLDPIEVADPLSRPVKSLHLFASPGAVPALDCAYLVQPGVSASPGLGPVVDALACLSFAAWLGRGSGMDDTVQHQQWALPLHYVAGHGRAGQPNQRDALRTHLSGAFCAGLADLPCADLKLVARNGAYSVVFDYREDLWGATDATTRGATWYWAFAEHYRDAIRAYYRGLVDAGVIAVARASDMKNDVMARSQYNTWGAQAGSGTQWNLFDQRALDTIWEQVRASGMRPGCFVIDDKWEGSYGLLEHSAERFPDFEQRLQDYRDAGAKIGMWAAFLRCEDPASLGLRSEHMLHDPDGKPIVKSGRDGTYYLSDITQPEVADVLRERARVFARRYRPDLVKFDFGYELPSLAVAAPADLAWGGERLLQLGLRIVIGAMREVLPDLVVMYYQLSPLLGKHVDLHSIDDVWLASEEYQQEVNRRLYFSSLLGEVGMPSYGSGGYDWPSMAETWFDTVASGAIGSLGSFSGDPVDSRPTAREVAKYNGLSALARRRSVFTVDALRAPLIGLSTAARSSSWARLESGLPVLLALRPRHFDGSAGVREYGGVVQTDVSVVVASRDQRGIGDAEELGVVPYGTGTVRITHGSGSAELTTFLHGGATARRTVPVVDGALTLDVAEDHGGDHVEWIRVRFAR